MSVLICICGRAEGSAKYGIHSLFSIIVGEMKALVSLSEKKSYVVRLYVIALHRDSPIDFEPGTRARN